MKQLPLFRVKTLKVLEVELRAFQTKLIKYHLGFLLWSWSYIYVAGITEWLEKLDDNAEELRRRSKNWKIKHWTQVLGDATRSPEDLVFDSTGMRVTAAEEKSFVTLFSSRRSMKNGWKTTNYVDLFRQRIALSLMQLFRPVRTTYLALWQIAFIEHVMKRERVWWAKIFWSAV